MVFRSAAERAGFRDAASLPRAIRLGEREVPLPEGASWIVIDDADRAALVDRATRKTFADGQIGAGFLSRFLVCVDPGARRLALAPPEKEDADFDAPWVPLLLMPEGANRALYPFVHLLLRDRDGTFAGGYGVLLDTGATTSMLDRGKIEWQHGAHPGWPLARGAFGDADMLGGRWAEEILGVPDVALSTAGPLARYGLTERKVIGLGPARFVDRPTGTWDQMFGSVEVTMGSHGALANDVLLRWRLVLDYRRARVYATPATPAPAPASASSARVGVAVSFGPDGCPEIRQVTDTNDPATRSELRAGDVLVAVDGANACRMWHHELQAALAGPPGTTKRLTLRRDAKAMDVVLPTAELLPERLPHPMPDAAHSVGTGNLRP